MCLGKLLLNAELIKSLSNPNVRSSRGFLQMYVILKFKINHGTMNLTAALSPDYI
jgi:hypothetical protein